MINKYKIFYRFIKEEHIYNEIITLIKKNNEYDEKRILNNNNNNTYDFFDKYISWDLSKNGYEFWYLIQLKYIYLLLLYNIEIIPCYYLRSICNRYKDIKLSDKIYEYQFKVLKFDNEKK